MSRPSRAAQHVLQARHLDERAITRRIHDRGLRMKHDIDAALLALFQVALQGARIAIQVLMRSELGRIDEYGNDDKVVLARAALIRLRCPACNAPIVGTSPIVRPLCRISATA